MLTDNQEKITQLIRKPLSKTGPDRVTYLENTALVQAKNKIMWEQHIDDVVSNLLLTLEDLEIHQKQGLSPLVYELYLELIATYGEVDKKYFKKDLSNEERDKKNRKSNSKKYLLGGFIMFLFFIICYVFFPLISKN